MLVMPKRSSISTAQVADFGCLVRAFHRAAAGKRTRFEVQAFAGNWLAEINAMRKEILDETIGVGQQKAFAIFDPKPRLIHAPTFRERVLHHALIENVGPVLDRALVADTYACRVGKGTLAAVARAQYLHRRFAYAATLDVRNYFASIDHARLKEMLRRRFKEPALLRLLDRIIDAHRSAPGCGLPIGALTSQYFANSYLDRLDRYLLEFQKVAIVRYMDDTAIWSNDRGRLTEAIAGAIEFAAQHLSLAIKPTWQIHSSRHGLSFCGFRIFANALHLSSRRKARYQRARADAEGLFLDGSIDALDLQRRYAAALSITAHAQAKGWRCRELARRPAPEV
jgi:hypothetical protein